MLTEQDDEDNEDHDSEKQDNSKLKPGGIKISKLKSSGSEKEGIEIVSNMSVPFENIIRKINQPMQPKVMD